mmetsp:Transcript_8578/g.13526  ORF Transcript_8578/g.13526 Transcript_8578/m.13526 type:complete len:144 (+) Transcript_8578:372-803(+)
MWGLTEPYSSEAAAGAQPNMPARAHGPLAEPPGPVSPAWCPAKKAATVSSCGAKFSQQSRAQEFHQSWEQAPSSERDVKDMQSEEAQECRCGGMGENWGDQRHCCNVRETLSTGPQWEAQQRNTPLNTCCTPWFCCKNIDSHA